MAKPGRVRPAASSGSRSPSSPSRSYSGSDSRSRSLSRSRSKSLSSSSSPSESSRSRSPPPQRRRYTWPQPVSEVPSQVLEALFNFQDREYLGKFNNKELADLQATVAFSSAMIARHISGRHQEARRAFAAAQATNLQFKEEIENKDTEIAQLKKALGLKEEEVQKEKRGRKAEGELLRVQLEVLKKENQEKAEEARVLQEQKVAKEALRNKREGDLLEQIKKLKEEMQARSELPQAPAPSAEEIIQDYRKSDDFRKIVTGFGEHAVTVLKKALMKDGLLDPSKAEEYTYEACTERDMNKEFDS